MVRQSKEKTQRLIRAIAVPLRNSTWKCGRIERLVVDYLGKQFRAAGRAGVPVREMLQHFSLTGKRKSEFLDAIKRLEKRRIIKVERL